MQCGIPWFNPGSGRSPGGGTLLPMKEMQETWVRSLGQEDSPGEGNGSPVQYSCLEKPMDRGAWRAAVHGVTQSQTYLLPESLLPQGNVLPPRPSIEKCSSNYLFQSSACWGTQTDTFPMGKNLATAKAAVSSWKGFRIIVWRSTATLFMK